MKKDTNQNLVEALDEVITERSVFEVLKQQIEKGSLPAIRLYFNYKYGKPQEKLDVSSEQLSLDFKDLVKFE